MTKSTRMFIVSFCLAIFTGNSSDAQISSAGIDSLVQKSLNTFQVAGVAVAIVKDGKVIHEKGYGLRSIDTKEPVDAYTNFQIASCSKPFTSAALAILVDEGKLSWKDPVKKFLPEFKMYNQYVTEHFLVEDLLCHRSGLSSNAGDLMTFPDGSDFTINDVLSHFQYLKPVSDFRTQFDYNNQLFIVAGELVARISGMSWEKFVQTRILNPLQMDASYSALTAADNKSNLAQPHAFVEGQLKTIPFFTNQLTNAAGGVVSNVHDLTKWMLMHLNSGKYGSGLEKQLFSEDRQREMWGMRTVIDGSPFPPSYNTHFFGYGLGWNLADVQGNLLVAHSGGINGMISELALIPDQQLGIVILTNTDGDEGAAVARALEASLLERYLGIAGMDWVAMMGRMIQFKAKSDTVANGVWKMVAQNAQVNVNKQNYVGIYEDKWFGKVEVFLKGEELWFQSHRSPKLNGALKFYKDDTFAITWKEFDDDADALVYFDKGKDGRADRMRLQEISAMGGTHFQDLDFRRIKGK